MCLDIISLLTTEGGFGVELVKSTYKVDRIWKRENISSKLNKMYKKKWS